MAKGKRQKRQSMRDLPANPDVLRLLDLVDPDAPPDAPVREDDGEDEREDDER